MPKPKELPPTKAEVDVAISTLVEYGRRGTREDPSPAPGSQESPAAPAPPSQDSALSPAQG